MRWRKRTGFSGAFPRRERDSLWPSERRELSQGGGVSDGGHTAGLIEDRSIEGPG